jgi:tetratricopeptide (TPR) repeat protein
METDDLQDQQLVAPLPEPNVAVQAAIEALAPIVEEPPKACCICGLDVTQRQRSRDRGGRYWCMHCSGFNATPDTKPGNTLCSACGRGTSPKLMVDQLGDQVCHFCNQVYLSELEGRQLHKDAVTANPEVEIRKLIRQMLNTIGWLAASAAVLTLYHFGLLYVHPKPWVPFVSGLYFLGSFAACLGIAIGIQYLRIDFRKRARRAEYDQMIRSVTNHVLALEDDSHAMGISEPPQPLRRRVERAVSRTEACAGRGVNGAAEIIQSLSKKFDAAPLIAFLLAQRPNTTDTVQRNREIATLSYLQGDLPTAASAITAILLRLQHDQEAMTRHALICFRNGELEASKKIFRQVVHLAREKKSEIDLAAAYCNLGMLHVMLSEWDDALNRYSQALTIYKRLNRVEGQADCMVSLALVAYRQKKTPENEGHFRKAMAINQRCKRIEGIAICCSLLGLILVEKEPPELKEAEKLLNKAVHLNLELGRPGGVATAYGNLGLARVKRQDFSGAREQLLKAQAIYQRISRPKMAVKIQVMLRTVGNMSAARAARK